MLKRLDYTSLLALGFLSPFITPETETKQSSYNNLKKEYSVFSFVLCVFTCVLSIPIVTGNGLTLTIIVRRVKKSPSYVSVGFLTCTDLLVGFTPWFFLTMYLNIDLLQDKVFCIFSAWFEGFVICLDVLAIFLITCERYLLITNWQLHRKYLGVRRQVYVSAGCVILSFVINTASFMTGEVLPMYGSCYWALDTNKKLDYLLTIPIYTIVLLVIIYCNSCTVLFVWRHKLKLITNQNAMNERDFKKEKKTTVIQAIILSFFLCSTLPLVIHSGLISDDPSKKDIALLDALIFIWKTSALVNPFIYAWRVPDIQEGYQKICDRLICKRRRNQVFPFHGIRGRDGPLQPRREFVNRQNETDDSNGLASVPTEVIGGQNSGSETPVSLAVRSTNNVLETCVHQEDEVSTIELQ